MTEVDLFASEENTYCPLFFSLMSVPLDGDALTSQWPRKRKYEFSPVKIMPPVLQKEQETVLLVAPNWPNHLWFPELEEHLTAPPWLILLWRYLLSQAKGKERRKPGRSYVACMFGRSARGTGTKCISVGFGYNRGSKSSFDLMLVCMEMEGFRF